jgi:cytochrome P450 family 138
MSHASPVAVDLPPGPRWPQFAQDVAYVTKSRWLMRALNKRFGTAFSMRLRVFGPTVVISDPALVKELFQQPTVAVRGPDANLGLILGPGSMFGLQGDEHRRHRKLLLPQFHGNRMRAYEGLIEKETLAEMSLWPEGQEFPVLPSTMRITLNTILRAVFGAEGAEFDTLRTLMPRLVTVGSWLALLPWLHHDFGRWSPWGRFMTMRKELDDIIGSLIARAEADPAFEQREDVLSLMLQARYEDGTAMSHSDIGDELFSLMVAGHETTATSLAWAVERLRRHPKLLARLVEEVDAGGSELLQATVNELLRTRPVIDGAARQVVAPCISLGPWVIPRGYTVAVNIGLTHQNEAVYRDAAAFNPDRFLGASPDTYSWVPFGGGTRRCPGAAFANMEMTVVLRTILREFRLVPTDAPSERWNSRGVAFAPAGGGRALVYRRRDRAAVRRVRRQPRSGGIRTN